MLGHLAVHYSRLGLHPSATRAELAAAYRAAALRHHPDKGGSATAFAEIKESYEILERYSGPRAYQPASLRYAHSRGGDWDGIWGILGSVVLPTAVGLGVGIRLMYVGGERGGLRAGGTSRISLQSVPNDASNGSVRPGFSTTPGNNDSPEKHPVT